MTSSTKTCPDNSSSRVQLKALVVRLCDQGITIIINDEFQNIKNWAGSLSTPPYVGLNEDRHLVCGPDAIMNLRERWWIPELFGLQPEESGRIPSNVTFKLNDEEITQETSIEFFLGVLLRSLKMSAEERLNGHFSKVVITVPVWFRSTHRIQVKTATRIAGFSECRLVNEEMAAVCGLVLESEDWESYGDLLVLSENFGIVNAVQYCISDKHNSYSIRADRHCRLTRNETENVLKFKLGHYFHHGGVSRGNTHGHGRLARYSTTQSQDPLSAMQSYLAECARLGIQVTARKSTGGLARSSARPYVPSAFEEFQFELVGQVLVLADSDWGRHCKAILQVKNMSAVGDSDFVSSTLIMSGASCMEDLGVDDNVGNLDHELLYAWIGNDDENAQMDHAGEDGGVNWSRWLGNVRNVSKSLFCIPISSVNREVTVYQENIMDKTKAIIGQLRVPLALLTTPGSAVVTFERNTESIVMFKKLECRDGPVTVTDPQIAGWFAEDSSNVDVDAELIANLCRELKCTENIENLEPQPGPSSELQKKRKISRSPSLLSRRRSPRLQSLK